LELLNCCERGDTLKVKELLLNSELNINIKDIKHGWTPLMFACEFGYHEIVQLLLNETNPKIGDERGKSAFYIACENNRLSLVKLMLTYEDIDVNQADMSWSPLIYAVQVGNLEMVQLLLQDPRVDVNQKDLKSASAFYIACRNGELEIVKLMTKRKDVRINETIIENGWTPLMIACELGHHDIVNVLLELESIQLNLINKHGETALFIACRNGHSEIVKLMLEQDSLDVNICNNYGDNPLLTACSFGHIKVVELLLRCRKVTHINSRNQDGSTAFYIACEEGQKEIIQLLLNSPIVDINQSDYSGVTPFIKVCKIGYFDLIQCMIISDHKIDVLATDMSGETAIDKLKRSYPHQIESISLLESFQLDYEETKLNLLKKMNLLGKYLFIYFISFIQKLTIFSFS